MKEKIPYDRKNSAPFRAKISYTYGNGDKTMKIFDFVIHSQFILFPEFYTVKDSKNNE
ncbi:MAG: hypothetical protein ACTTKL_00255 [Treponema sp.]